jgi:hypothetical protein
MNGVSTSYKCRSEPHSPVDVMRMTASVGSWIVGSGTFSTRTSRLPCQVTALIAPRSLRHVCASARAVAARVPLRSRAEPLGRTGGTPNWPTGLPEPVRCGLVWTDRYGIP